MKYKIFNRELNSPIPNNKIILSTLNGNIYAFNSNFNSLNYIYHCTADKYWISTCIKPPLNYIKNAIEMDNTLYVFGWNEESNYNYIQNSYAFYGDFWMKISSLPSRTDKLFLIIVESELHVFSINKYKPTILSHYKMINDYEWTFINSYDFEINIYKYSYINAITYFNNDIFIALPSKIIDNIYDKVEYCIYKYNNGEYNLISSLGILNYNDSEIIMENIKNNFVMLISKPNTLYLYKNSTTDRIEYDNCKYTLKDCGYCKHNNIMYFIASEEYVRNIECISYNPYKLKEVNINE